MSNIFTAEYGVVFRSSKVARTTFGKGRASKEKKTIVFSDVEYNIGEGYNSTSGIFTTPRKGTYLFTVQFYVRYDYRIDVGIVVNGETPIALSSFDPGNGACHNFEAIANLDEGDTVQVMHLYSVGDSGLNNKLNSNFFSGAMIR